MKAEDYLGTVIRRKRQDSGLTIQAVADAIGSDVGNVSRMENNRQRITGSTLEAVAAILGTTPSEIWADAELLVKNRQSISEPSAPYRAIHPVLKQEKPKDRVPLISWVRAGNWSAVTDNHHPFDADEWVPCPVAHSRSTFALQVRGESMHNPHGRPSFHDGDIIYIDPERNPEQGSLVVVRLDDSAEATFKKLIIEGNKRFLKALNPAWPEPIIEINGNATICGVVIFKGEKIS